MLLRELQDGWLAIAQPSHAWLSGQLARAWGNERFGPVSPAEEVFLAAEQHDIGMGAWDMAPDLDPRTGLPYAFMELPLAVHLAQWRDGPRRVLGQSRYSGLLVSMHGARLYRRRDLDRLAPEEAEDVRDYLSEQEGLQARVRRALGEPPEEEIARNSQLIWIWDYLSLALCLGWAPCTAHDVPTATGPVEMEIRPTGQGLTHSVRPWPFGAGGPVTVRCEARRLQRPYSSEAEMRAGLEAAPWETLAFALVPG